MVTKASNKPVRGRSCVGCGTQLAKNQLLRIVRTKEGVVNFDPTGRLAGRGAYVCSAKCFETACKKNKLDRALKVTLSAEDYERVAAQIGAHNTNEANQ